MGEYPRKKRIKLSPAKLRKLYAEVIERDNHTCQGEGCPGGFPLDPPHHIVFRSQGGDDTAENLTLLCRYCHGQRHGINYVR